MYIMIINIKKIFKYYLYRFSLEYIKNYSLFQEFKIIILTIKCVFTGNGADAGKNTIEKEISDNITETKEESEIKEKEIA